MLPALLLAATAYRTAFNNWTLAKNQFQQYRTETTRLSAIDTVKKLLSSRNSWQLEYLKNLRQNLADDTQIANYSQTTLYLSLETQINYLVNYSSAVSTITSLNQAAKSSSEWESRLNNTDSLTTSARLQILNARLTHLQSQLQPFVDQASPSPTLDLAKSKLTQFSASTDPKIRKQLLLDAANVLSQLP